MYRDWQGNVPALAVLLCISVLLRRMWPLNRASEVIALIFIVIGGVAWSSAWRYHAARLIERLVHL